MSGSANNLYAYMYNDDIFVNTKIDPSGGYNLYIIVS